MNILLINPPQNLANVLGEGKAMVQKYEPLGLLYIAAVVREAGYSVSVIDAYAEELTLAQLCKRIELIRPDVIGISTLTCNGDVVCDLGKQIKQQCKDTLVVLGNIHASVFADSYLRNGVCDIVVHGEGEYIFLDIIRSYQHGKPFSDISSVSFLSKDTHVVFTGGHAVIDDLASLPFPARDLVDQSLYNLTEISNQLYIGAKGTTSKTIFTSRGCPNRCYFCVLHKDQKPRFNDASLVVDELELLQKEYHASYVFIMDPLFFANRKRVFEICDQIRSRGLSVKWGADAHVRYIDEEILLAIEKAGCFELSFGIESGVQKLLNNVNKGVTLTQIEETINLVKRCSHIEVGGLFILGIMGETYADSLATIEFAKRLPLDIAQFSVLVPYPGSPLFEELTRKGKIDTGILDDGTIDGSAWKRYSGYVSFTENEPIWVTEQLTAAQLKQLQKKAQREFYLRPRLILKHLKRVRLHNILRMLRIAKSAFFLN